VSWIHSQLLVLLSVKPRWLKSNTEKKQHVKLQRAEFVRKAEKKRKKMMKTNSSPVLSSRGSKDKGDDKTSTSVRQYCSALRYFVGSKQKSKQQTND